MSRSRFHAKVISTGPMLGVDQHIGWASDAAGSGPHLFLMREAEGSELCIVSGDETTYATCYGGLLSAKVRPTETTIALTAEAAAELGVDPQLVITYDQAIADAEYLQGQLDLTVG